MDRQAFLKLVADGRCGGVYLLEGVEEHLKEEALRALRRALLPEDMAEMNETVLENPPTAALIAAAETLPFLAEKRLVVVREHAGLLRGEADEKLISYLPRLPDTTVVVFYHRGKCDARKKLYRAVKACGEVVPFEPMRDAELNGWICDRVRALGKSCTPAVAAQIAFTAGSDTAQLCAEIDKLIGYAGSRPSLTEEDVRAVVTRSLEYNVFTMVDAVVAGNEQRAFALLRDMLLAGQERLGILAMLLRQYRMLQHIKIMQYEKRTPRQMQEALGVKGFVLDRYLRQAKMISGGQVKRGVQVCLETEYAVKAGKLNQDGALEAAMMALFAMRH